MEDQRSAAAAGSRSFLFFSFFFSLSAMAAAAAPVEEGGGEDGSDGGAGRGEGRRMPEGQTSGAGAVGRSLGVVVEVGRPECATATNRFGRSPSEKSLRHWGVSTFPFNLIDMPP